MSDFLSGLSRLLSGGALDQLPREPEPREDYGLTGAQIEPFKSPYEPTLAPGETRNLEDLRSMLWNVIESAGSGVVPAIGPRALKTSEPARTRPRYIETPQGPGVTTTSSGRVQVKNPITGATLYDLSPSEFRAYRRAGAFPKGEVGRDIEVFHGTTASKLRPEPGLHVGTKEQANFRANLGTDPITKQMREGAKVFPLKITPRKMADITDLGGGMSFPGNKAEELVRAGVLSRPEADAVLKSRTPTKSLYDLLLQKKYDALRYANQFEGAGKSYEVINPKIVSGRFGGEPWR